MQSWPLPSYPVLHVHEKEPIVFAHTAFALQLCVPLVHSLISTTKMAWGFTKGDARMSVCHLYREIMKLYKATLSLALYLLIIFIWMHCTILPEDNMYLAVSSALNITTLTHAANTTIGR